MQNKKLALQGIGEFTVGSFYDNPFENEKGGSKLPDNTISFRVNPKVGEDPDLIQYISQHSGKIKPLASADLDSFLTTGRQLLNISKPFVIEGIGTLSRDAHNEIEFTQGVISLHIVEEHPAKKHKSHAVESNDSVHFDDNYLKPAKSYDNTTRRVLIWTAVVIGLAVIGWIGFYFFSPASKKTSTSNETPTETVVPAQPTIDTAAQARADSIQKAKNDSMTAAAQNAQNVQNSSTYSYLIVIERAASKERALKRYADLIEWGHKVIMTTKDSVTFKLAIPIKGPLSDSARNRDSLTQFFGRKTYVELRGS
ncbi:MAG: hypothetical protein C5B52_04740 [Bacteroidetes bacterium]|nr:MAG: hypothetical protein C5B52_04740 [Bacteroidota bacterium]